MRKILYLSVMMAILLIGTACSDFLDITPSGQRDDEMVWTSQTDVNQFLNNIYNHIPVSELHRDEPWVGCADEADLTWTVYSTYDMNLGNWAEGREYWNHYGKYYSGIRKTFELEAKIDRCAEMPTELRERHKHEAMFLRGYFYWLLIRQYGPVVLIKEMHDYDTDFKGFRRAPYDECVQYIVQMMNDAEQGLPLYWDNISNYGRPNKIVCKSLKSIVLHHAASPQFNGGEEIRSIYSNFTNPDGTQLISTTYDENKWKLAAEAAKEVIQIAEDNPDILGLYSNAGSIYSTDHNPYKSYTYAQLEAWNKEMIWGRVHSKPTVDWIVHACPGPKELGGIAPTQRLVDAFLMENGKPIDDPTAGYIEEGWATTDGNQSNPKGRNIDTEAGRVGIINDLKSCIAWGHWKGDRNMYANREPRFYASVLYNGAIILPITEAIERRNYFNTGAQGKGLGKVELYYGGISRGTGSFTFYPRTGYLTKKRVDPLAEMGADARRYPQNYPIIFIRYANILLNYIEALNEYDPGNADIQKYWDMIRVRAGVPGVFTASPQIKGNRDMQRDFIIRERMIEMNMEGDRYFTTRRRLLAHQRDTESMKGLEKFGDGGPMYGMDIDAGAPASNNFLFEGFYQRTAFEERVFKMQFYLFPLPKNEVDKGEGDIVQNPNWRGK